MGCTGSRESLIKPIAEVQVKDKCLTVMSFERFFISETQMLDIMYHVSRWRKLLVCRIRLICVVGMFHSLIMWPGCEETDSDHLCRGGKCLDVSSEFEGFCAI